MTLPLRRAPHPFRRTLPVAVEVLAEHGPVALVRATAPIDGRAAFVWLAPAASLRDDIRRDLFTECGYCGAPRGHLCVVRGTSWPTRSGYVHNIRLGT